MSFRVGGVVWCGLVIWALSVSAQERRRTADEQLARQAAILATNRLVDNIADEDAFLLLQVASRLDPEDEVVKNTLRLVRQEMTPDAIETKCTEPKLFEAMITRADDLLQKKQHIKLACLYYLVAQKMYPTNARSTLALIDLREQQKVSFKLEELLGSLPLFDPKPPEPPPTEPEKDKVAEKPPPPPAEPLLDPAKADGKFTVFAWEGTRWSEQGVNKITFHGEGGGGELKNSYPEAQYILFGRRRLLTADFDAQIELKGGKEVVLQVNENSEERFTYDVPGPGWHKYRFTRKNGRVSFAFDGRERYARKADGAEAKPLLFGIVVWKNQEAEFKNFP